ncbi:MAG: hypothetical protein JEZ05_00965 [Tenericutes bacterium]|nr:hypothetical protein [Mycoplasmatota bacterium]
MKRILLLFVMLVLFALSACNSQNTRTMINYELDEYVVNNYLDASMVIVEESITNKGLTLELRYYGKDEGLTGSWYTLFVYEDSEWNELANIVDGDVAWTMIAYSVEKNRAKEISTDWEWLYGELSIGKYLIIKQFTNHRDAGDNDNYYLGCEFTIE